MLRFAAPLLLLLLPALASADRITEMSAAEQCVYKAKLSVAAYFYFRQGKPRQEVTIHWHGDETESEIAFVSRVLDEAYSTAEADQRDRPEQRLSEQAFGDRAYNACIEKLDHTRMPPSDTFLHREARGPAPQERTGRQQPAPLHRSATVSAVA